MIYNGVSSASYVRDGTNITIQSAFNYRVLNYPLTTHQVYNVGDTVTITFLGPSGLAGKNLTLYIINTSPIKARDALNDAFKGNLTTIKNLINNAIEKVNMTLNSTGDFSYNITVSSPGDYVVLVINETKIPNYILEIYSATLLEVLDYSMIVSAPSSVTIGNPVNVNINLNAPQSSTGYRYGALIIYEPSYMVEIKLETNGTVPGTIATGNGVVLINGTANRVFKIAGIGLEKINKEFISQNIGKAFGANNVSISFTDIINSNSTSLSLMTDASMPAGKYILLVGVWETQTGRRVVSFYQGYVILTTPPTPPPPPPPTIEEIEAMPIEKAVEYIQSLSITEASSILEKISVSRAVEIFESMAMDRAVNLIGSLSVERGASILENLSMERAKNIVENCVISNLTSKVAEIAIIMNVDKSASLILEVTVAPTILETMVEMNSRATAIIVERMVDLDVIRTVEILEDMSPESLAMLFIEIARLPHTPETVAKLLEALSEEKAIEVVKLIIDLGALKELSEVFEHLSTERLNLIYGSLTMKERLEILPYLSSTTFSKIYKELLPLPDLKPTSIVISEAIVEKPSIVNVTVVNIGNVDSPEFKVSLIVNNTVIQTITSRDLLVNSETVLSFEWTPLSEGIYELKAIVDPENNIMEINEDNNIIIKYVTSKVVLPDLIVSIAKLPESLEIGKEYNVSVIVKNIGNDDAKQFSVRLDFDGRTIGTKIVDVLLAGSEKSLSFTWKPEVDGTFTLKAIADPDNKVKELNETNNTAEVKVTVVAPPWYVTYWPLIILIIIIIVLYVVLRYWSKKS